MIIRPIQPADRDEWHRLRHALWPGYSSQQLIDEIDPFFTTDQIWSLPAAVFVADRGDETLGGFIEVSRRPLADGCNSTPVGYIEGWFVDPELRRRGIGASLIQAGEEWARACGCQEMASDCVADNDISHLAHRRLGFVSSELCITLRKSLNTHIAIKPAGDWIGIVPYPLAVAAAVKAVTDVAAGGIDIFLGTTRQETSSNGQELRALGYEAYGEMAVSQLHDLARQARERWPIVRLVLLHRIGRVSLGEPSVLIAVSTPHRGDAFDACRWLIDTLKAEVTIWKKEIWADGSGTWIHPAKQP